MAGWDYALVHAKYTIPPALLLSALFRPLHTGVDSYKITYIVIIAVVATIPWDSYLLKNEVWTYPEDAVLGATYFRIPVEELFFFVIQTFMTSMVCLLMSKSIVATAYLPTLPTPPPSPSVEEGKIRNPTSHQVDYKHLRRTGIFGAIIIGVITAVGVRLMQRGGHGTYMGLILAWAGPVILFLWCLSHQFILSVPRRNLLIPIIAPTLYLWFVDTLALKNGTWVINPEKSLGIKLFKHLDIEEATFFFVTNTLITFGQLAFDHALAVLHGFPEFFPSRIPSWPSTWLMIQGLCIRVKDYPGKRVQDIRDSIVKLQGKSRSFSLASSVFEGRLRIDLILLYSFCRNADDLIDEAESPEEARKALSQLSQAVSSVYADRQHSEKQQEPNGHSEKSSSYDLPEDMSASLAILPNDKLPLRPIQGLLEGFEMDLDFPPVKSIEGGEADDDDDDDNDNEKTAVKAKLVDTNSPIKTEKDLERYGYCVAGTVAELLLNLVFYHSPPTSVDRDQVIQAGVNMGIALQYINIARDVRKDAAIGRCYLPTDWLTEQKITQSDVIANPNRAEVKALRKRILAKAMDIYSKNKGQIEMLPEAGGARKGVRGAVENYVEIGRVLVTRIDDEDETQGAYGDERATVGKSRRLWVFLKALWA